nr:ammonia-forming cytochrome c nitrite reductase subunit c552 [Myxococcaceae bacterium]
AITDLIDDLVKAKADGISAEKLAPALAFQRKAQWKLDFIAAENSMGFHAPQEAARILGEAADEARQGQVVVAKARAQASLAPVEGAPVPGSK